MRAQNRSHRARAVFVGVFMSASATRICTHARSRTHTHTHAHTHIHTHTHTHTHTSMYAEAPMRNLRTCMRVGDELFIPRADVSNISDNIKRSVICPRQRSNVVMHMRRHSSSAAGPKRPPATIPLRTSPVFLSRETWCSAISMCRRMHDMYARAYVLLLCWTQDRWKG